MLRSSRSWPVLGSLTLLTALLLLVGCQSKDSPSQQQQEMSLPDDELSIEDPWVEPAPAGSTAALYMTIANGKQRADTLLSVRAPIVDSSAAYGPAAGTDAGMEVMEMLPIPARTRMTLKPGSTRVKLVNLSRSLDEGTTPILTLEFAQSGLQRLRVPVRTAPPSSQP